MSFLIFAVLFEIFYSTHFPLKKIILSRMDNIDIPRRYPGYILCQVASVSVARSGARPRGMAQKRLGCSLKPLQNDVRDQKAQERKEKWDSQPQLLSGSLTTPSPHLIDSLNSS